MAGGDVIFTDYEYVILPCRVVLECRGSTPLWGRRLGADLAGQPTGPAKPRQRCRGTALHGACQNPCYFVRRARIGSTRMAGEQEHSMPQASPGRSLLHTTAFSSLPGLVLECRGSTPLWGRRLGADLAGSLPVQPNPDSGARHRTPRTARPFQTWRRATIGSTRMARRAGT